MYSGINVAGSSKAYMFIHKPSQLPREHNIYSPAATSGSTELFKHTSLHCPTRYPFTPGSRECTYGQSALPRNATSEHNSAQPGIEPAISRL